MEVYIDELLHQVTRQQRRHVRMEQVAMMSQQQQRQRLPPSFGGRSRLLRGGGGGGMRPSLPSWLHIPSLGERVCILRIPQPEPLPSVGQYVESLATLLPGTGLKHIAPRQIMPN